MKAVVRLQWREPQTDTRARIGGNEDMGQVNVNPGGGSPDSGFGAGMIIGIIVLILIVLVLVFYAGPQIININTGPRSLAEILAAA